MSQVTSVKIVGSGVIYGARLFEILATYEGRPRPVSSQVSLKAIRRESGDESITLAATKKAAAWMNTPAGRQYVEKQIGLIP